MMIQDGACLQHSHLESRDAQGLALTTSPIRADAHSFCYSSVATPFDRNQR
mgnify:CR=1 FL=1